LPGGVEVRGKVVAVGQAVAHFARTNVPEDVAPAAPAVDGHHAGRGHREVAVRGAYDEVGRPVAEVVGVLAQIVRLGIDLDVRGAAVLPEAVTGNQMCAPVRGVDDIVVDIFGAVDQLPHLRGGGDLRGRGHHDDQASHVAAVTSS